MSSLTSHLHHIPAGRPFADDLVRGFLTLVPDINDMADNVILLPSRRLVHAVHESFVRLGPENGQLLPQMLPLGDVEEDAAELITAGWDSEDLPSVMDALERQLLLSQLVEKFAHGTKAESIALAGALGQFLDQIQIANCDTSKLADLAEVEYADHWQKVLKFLGIATTYWPQILKDKKKSDIALWRHAAITARAEAWRVSPPKGFVIIAGSSGSIPATRILMERVLGLDHGHLVLSGLDTEMDDADWDDIQNGNQVDMITHPQYALSQLLSFLERERQDASLWCGTEISPHKYDAVGSGRFALLREAMRPSKQTTEWRRVPEKQEIKQRSLEGLTRIDCADRQEEADVIALAMRETLEDVDKTAVLITPDNHLAEMVSMSLRRWDINVKPSSGHPLSKTTSAQFMGLIFEAWKADFSAVSLLAMARHSLSSGGLEKTKFRDFLRKIELKLLRDNYIEGGLDGLISVAKEKDQSLAEFVEKHLKTPLQSLLDLNGKAEISLRDMVDAHSRAAENLSATNIDPLLIWHGQEGGRLQQFMHKLALHGDDISLSPADYGEVLQKLLSGETIYPRDENHPRLAILGNVEARMHTADLTILGGMNEGIMPPEPSPDPWMSNSMRLEFGLPPVNWRIGHAAHDVMLALARPDVLITQAKRDGDVPTQPSRWLWRLDAVLDVAGLSWGESGRLPYLLSQLNKPSGKLTPVSQPIPTPPISARPKKFSATSLNNLLRDPYVIYASHILRLRALEPLARSLSAADKGTLIHAIFRDFIRTYPAGALPDDAKSKLTAIARDAFAPYLSSPQVVAYWWPRFEAMAEWLITIEQERRVNLDIKISYAEVEGTMEIETSQGNVELRARADRIDLDHDSRLHIIDYKTGMPPSKKQVTGGRELQLSVEAILATKGGFKELEGSYDIASLAYWYLSGKRDGPAKINDMTPENGIDFIIEAQEGVRKLLEKFCDENQGYPSQPFAPEASIYSDYKHLARVGEWSVLGGDDA